MKFELSKGLGIMGKQKKILDPPLSANLNRKGGHVYRLLSLKEYLNRRKNNQATWDM